jgi:hypothetical protein
VSGTGMRIDARRPFRKRLTSLRVRPTNPGGKTGRQELAQPARCGKRGRRRTVDQRGGSDLGQQAGNFLSSFLNYLRTRSPEHWLFFAIGVIVGLLIG